jgi:hypothetical protein
MIDDARFTTRSASQTEFVERRISKLIFEVVRSEGLEPPRFYSLPPQGSASTNSATSAKISTGRLDRAGSTAPM